MSKKPDKRAYMYDDDYLRAREKYKHDMQKGAHKNHGNNYSHTPSQKEIERAKKKEAQAAQEQQARAQKAAIESEQTRKEGEIKFYDAIKKAQNQELKPADELLDIGLDIFRNVSNANLGKSQSESYYKFSCDILKYAFLFGKQEATSCLRWSMPDEYKNTQEMLDENNRKVIEKFFDRAKYAASNKAMQIIKYNGAMYGDSLITDKMKTMVLYYFNKALEEINCGKYKLPNDFVTSASCTPLGIQIEVKELARDSVVYGKISTKTITTPATCKVDGATVIVEEYRSVTFPDSIKPGKEFTVMRAVKTLDGKELSKNEVDCLKIKYDTNGKLIYLSTPGKLYIPTNPDDPVLVMHKKQICTLPVSGSYYLHLTDLVQHNSGQVVKEINENIPFEAGLVPKPSYLPPENYNILKVISNAQITEIKAVNEVLGFSSEAIVKSSYQYTHSGHKIVVQGYRSVTLPDSIKPSTNGCTVKLPLKSLNGADISIEGDAYFGVGYNAIGKLEKLYMPFWPFSHNDRQGSSREQTIDEPVLIPYKKQICTLPVSTGHFKYLESLIDIQPDHLMPFKIIPGKYEGNGYLGLIGSSPLIIEDNENCTIS